MAKIPTKPSEVLYRAASRIANYKEDCCCPAIARGWLYTDESTRAEERAHEYFSDVFKPDDNPTFWFGDPRKNPFNANWSVAYTQELTAMRKHRIIALLMAAAMAESVGE